MPKVLPKADRNSASNRIERILLICLLLALVLGGYVLAVRFGKAPSPFRH
jgi:hypothetical protein